jgi:hypothetical protein
LPIPCIFENKICVISPPDGRGQACVIVVIGINNYNNAGLTP